MRTPTGRAVQSRCSVGAALRGASVPSSWIVARATKPGGRNKGRPRFRVLYRLGGRESSARYAGSFASKSQAVARKRWVDGELAALRVPDLCALVEPFAACRTAVEGRDGRPVLPSARRLPGDRPREGARACQGCSGGAYPRAYLWHKNHVVCRGVLGQHGPSTPGSRVPVPTVDRR